MSLDDVWFMSKTWSLGQQRKKSHNWRRPCWWASIDRIDELEETASSTRDSEEKETPKKESKSDVSLMGETKKKSKKISPRVETTGVKMRIVLLKLCSIEYDNPLECSRGEFPKVHLTLKTDFGHSFTGC